ncbi:Zinc finger CCHC domain-containing protein 4, partial [Operophtera brumata]
MGRKRKIEPKETKHTETQKSSSVEVIVEDVTSHPICMHGPTLLFSSEKGRYFACASCRDKKECTVLIDEEDWSKEGVKKRNEKYYNLMPKIDKAAAWKNLNEELYLLSSNRKHGKDHRVITGLTDEQLAAPSSWLPTLENDAVEAQYIFAKKSVGTILNILKNNNISNIICIGAPSVHEAAQSSPDFDSILLDFDKRHHQFQAPAKFVWYNMFNNYMFNGNEDEGVLKKFLKKAKSGGTCIVMDPPFGGRVEPLTHTLKELSATYREVCEKTDDELLPVIWAFPYFSEPYITGTMPEIKMHDYQVEYGNHKKFHNKKSGRKHGSPVRLFTNLPLLTIDLSNDKNYKLCDKCKYWVSATNNHCTKCKECTSKNGMTYKHCNACKQCVKPTFKHCKECERCVLEKG